MALPVWLQRRLGAIRRGPLGSSPSRLRSLWMGPISIGPLALGEQGERAAASYLKRLGYKIVFTRHRRRYGEIDIIAVDDKTVVFVEVKTRRNASQGRPANAVDFHRQSRLTRAALAFLKSHGLLQHASRFDVVEVIWPEGQKRPQIRHLPNAFPAVGHGQLYN